MVLTTNVFKDERKGKWVAEVRRISDTNLAGSGEVVWSSTYDTEGEAREAEGAAQKMLRSQG